MKKSEFIEQYYGRFFTHIDELDFTKDKQISGFLMWCFDNGFLDNISEEDIEYFCEENDTIYLPLLRNHKITIGTDHIITSNYESFYVGIDHSDCFNKVRQCSIVIRFPITSKREEKVLYKTLNAILDKKSVISKYWFNHSSTMWYGSYLTNMN